jgi:tetratricopeptide (TPR) repeat protein
LPDSLGSPASAHTLAYDNLGNVYQAQGEYEQAIESYRRAIELNPKDATPHTNLGSVYYDQGEYEQAMRAYENALRLPDSLGSPASAHTLAYDNLGSVYKAQGEYEQTIESYTRAIAINANYSSAWYRMACCYAVWDNVDDAVQALQRAIQLNRECREIAKTDSDFDGIREDERFKKLISDP